MKFLVFSFRVAIFGLLTACRGVGVNPPDSPPRYAAAQTAFHRDALPSAIIVANFSGHAIRTYALNVRGNASPSSSIRGKRTGFGTPDNVALDSSGNIYTSINGKTVGVYAANAHGNARPIRQLSGSNTQLKFPIGVAVDSGGYLYVADCGYGNVKVFAPGAKGNASPIRVIGVTGGCVISLAIDSSDDLYATSGDNQISEFSSYAQGNNLVKIIYESERKKGDSIRSIALDSHSDIYVGNLLAKDIRVFAASATGIAKPIRTIAGSQTHLGAPSGLSLDSNDKLYVTICHYCSNGSGTDSVLVFAAGAKGNVKPAVISGKKTKLDVPTDLVIRK